MTNNLKQGCVEFFQGVADVQTASVLIEKGLPVRVSVSYDSYIGEEVEKRFAELFPKSLINWSAALSSDTAGLVGLVK